jgi:hypothetical protein
MKWTTDDSERVDRKNYGMGVKKRGRWKRTGCRCDEKVMEKRES